MCDFCEEHDDLFEKPLFYEKFNLGIGGDVNIWIYIDAAKKQICMHLLNDSNGNTYEYHRGCRFCPVCGKDFFEVKE
ncbi:hypothetical protein [Butyrivibrio sp. MC2021]|uniref:hypothetical protein n=1 Tax=Butyrivibrio sp. MC2021 TaxID=1408306 RepID=UPI00047C33EF|nr:hypothetical protein [Butyrivibrio sp. MC2021]